MRLKAVVGNSALVIWLIFGLVEGVKIINLIPDRLGDNAGALLPAYVVALVVILIAGRFAIERIVNAVWREQEQQILVLRTQSEIETGASFAVQMVVVGATIIVGPINVGSDQVRQAASDVNAQQIAGRNGIDSGSEQPEFVFLGGQ